MLIRREIAGDEGEIRRVTAAAFARLGSDRDPPGPRRDPPVEVVLVDELRAGSAWLPALSLVATDAAGTVVGHVLATRALVGSAAVLGLGPISVQPEQQGCGIGSALMHAVLGAADALDEPLVGLVGSVAYYSRFGFRPATEFGITAPDPSWGVHFQVRTLTAYRPSLRGSFRFADAFAAA